MLNGLTHNTYHIQCSFEIKEISFDLKKNPSKIYGPKSNTILLAMRIFHLKIVNK